MFFFDFEVSGCFWAFCFIKLLAFYEDPALTLWRLIVSYLSTAEALDKIALGIGDLISALSSLSAIFDCTLLML